MCIRDSNTAGASRKRRRKKKKNIAHTRNEATNYYIDGIRVQGNKGSKKKKKGWNNIFKKDNKNAQPNTEEYTKINENQFITTKKEKTSTFSIDVDKASYAMVRQRLKQYQSVPPANAVRIEEMINYFNYDYENPTGEEPFSIYSATAECPWQKEDLLLHVGIKGCLLYTSDAADE